MAIDYIHLVTHTEYSLVDGLCRIPDLIKAAKAKQFPAVAVTDRCNLFGMVKFYRAALAAGIKPIIGSDLRVIGEASDTESRLVVLCQNNTGYQNLTRLISKAYLQGKRHKTPLVDKSWLNAESMAGLIGLSGAQYGEIGQALLQADISLAKHLLLQYQQCFPGAFYLQLQNTGRDNELVYQEACIALARAHATPLVATNDVCFLNSDDFEAHEARVCIHEGYQVDDKRRPKLYSAEQYLRSSDEMQVLFASTPEALQNSVIIAQKCNIELTLGQNYLPEFPVPDGFDGRSYLAELSRQGLEQRLTILFKDLDVRQENQSAYSERLSIELDVINSMGFAGYFLIVADFISWAKTHNVPVGPGRGSGAGSLVAYALGITDLDPLAYDLLFERFLNPERVSMPDFDVDFCMDKRDLVIDYVANRYGKDCVSQIITFGTMAAKAVVRDVGRVLGYPYGFVDKIAKLIPFELGITLTKALEQEEQLQQRYYEEEEVKSLIDLAKKLEGVTRNAGKHAGGVVISPSLLTDFTPLYCEEGGGNVVSQFDKDDVEAVGLVKFDFLGLRTLTIIDWALNTLAESCQTKIDINLIPLHDTKTFDLLKSCQTTAVFQLESRGMKDLIKRLQPDCFEDIIALVALFRPGPLQSGMVDDFINRKHGRAKVEYPHPDLEPILKPTYGVILYQEQVMQIAQVLANYTLGGADLLRRAMGKKKPEEMAKQREIFITGAKAREVDETLASAIFDLMENFAGYGFNKSHSAAYALVSYQTAWLKAHYPAAFMAAVLSSDMDNTDKVVVLIDECHKMNLPIKPPCINYSFYRFTVGAEECLLYGLGAIKGVGQAVIEMLTSEREAAGCYQDLYDLCARIDLKKINRRVFEALIRSGALDCLGMHRAELMAKLENAIQSAEQVAQDAAIGQADMFGDCNLMLDTDSQAALCEPWSDNERLQGEKETLGLYFSGHPINQYLNELCQFTSSSLAAVRPAKEKTLVISGLVAGVRQLRTKKGHRMAIVTLDDSTRSLDITLFPELFNECHEQLISDSLLVVIGEASLDDFSGSTRVTAKECLTLEQAREKFAKCLTLTIRSEQIQSGFINNLQALFDRVDNGTSPVWINYVRPEASVKLRCSHERRVVLSDQLLLHLKQLIGSEDVAVEY